jgi:arsenate reductase-like glutaredoxin family protein
MKGHLKLSRRMNRQPHSVDALVVPMEAQGLVETIKDLRRNTRELVSRGLSARKPTSAQLEALGVYRTHKRCDCQECRVARSWLKESDLEKWPGIEETARRKLD